MPPRYNFFKYLKNASSNGLEAAWQFKRTNFCLPLVTTATSKVDVWFSKTHFGRFYAKVHQNSKFGFAISMKSVTNVVRCGNLGWTFRLMVSWRQFSFLTFFLCFNDHWGTLSPCHRCHSTRLSISFQKNSLFVDFQQENKVVKFWMGIPSQKSETVNHLKTLTMVSMETRLV